MTGPSPKVLIYGYGNPGRLDDGLGTLFAHRIEPEAMGTTIEADYQLNVEDASLLAEHDIVLFVDASVSGPAPFSFSRIRPKASTSFTSHSVAPEGLLELSAQIFHRHPQAYLLGIRGYDFDEFGEKLTAGADANLRAALDFVTSLLKTGRFDEAAEQFAAGSKQAVASEMESYHA